MTTCRIGFGLKGRPRGAGPVAERLDDALRAAAPPLAVPDGFEIRVMAAVRAASHERPAAASVHAWPRPLWAAVAACAVLALALWGRDKAEERAIAHAGARATISATVAASDWFAAWSDAAPSRLTGSMQTEVDNLVDDARRAAGVLLAGLD